MYVRRQAPFRAHLILAIDETQELGVLPPAAQGQRHPALLMPTHLFIPSSSRTANSDEVAPVRRVIVVSSDDEDDGRPSYSALTARANSAFQPVKAGRKKKHPLASLPGSGISGASLKAKKSSASSTSKPKNASGSSTPRTKPQNSASASAVASASSSTATTIVTIAASSSAPRQAEAVASVYRRSPITIFTESEAEEIKTAATSSMIAERDQDSDYIQDV